MILILQNTTYSEFNKWLRLRAIRYGFSVSYDKDGFLYELGDIEDVPAAFYPFRIYLSKKDIDGKTYNYNAVFVVEKAGCNLRVTPKPIMGQEGIPDESIQPILTEIFRDWKIEKPEETKTLKAYLLDEPNDKNKQTSCFDEWLDEIKMKNGNNKRIIDFEDWFDEYKRKIVEDYLTSKDQTGKPLTLREIVIRRGGAELGTAWNWISIARNMFGEVRIPKRDKKPKRKKREIGDIK